MNYEAMGDLAVQVKELQNPDVVFDINKVCNFNPLTFVVFDLDLKSGQRLHEMVLKPPAEIDDLLPLWKKCATVIIYGFDGDNGYFTEKEASMMMEAGATSVSLIPHRLCVETAIVALLATIMLWFDSRQSSVC
ncbi:hypothetical protein RIF29_18977 [Crotalaria pallida]|uniref:16S rRNA (uracil(1498)-N(3))-methyltransferase n=1 Tax=Crotalaria pallida TaxID=3830 RepID=A0AAN9I625_CROPI